MSARFWTALVLWRFGKGREFEGDQRLLPGSFDGRAKAVEDDRSPMRYRDLLNYEE